MNFYKNIKVGIVGIIILAGSLSAASIRFSDITGKPGLSLLSQSVSGVEIEFNMPLLNINDYDINGEIMQVLSAPSILLFPNKEGAPNTPGLSRYIAIPKGASAKVSIIEEKKEIFKDINLAPMHNIPLETDDSPLKYEKDVSIYSKDAYYPETPVLISEPMKIREVDVVILNITPFQYNPVKKELIVYKKLRVKVDFIGGNGHFGDDRYRSRFWEPLLWGHIINYASLPKIDFSDPARYRGYGYEYIIITRDDPVFLAWADSIKRWRTLEGIKTGVFTVTQIGGNDVSKIETFIDTAYSNWQVKPIAFLMLGDYPNPTLAYWSYPYGSLYTDLKYSDINGDTLPDVYSGRMFADNATHLQVIISKILQHERTPPTAFNVYDEPLMACGWQTERWFQLCIEIMRRFFIIKFNKHPKRAYKIYSGTPTVGGPWSTAPNTDLVVAYFGPNGLGYIPATNDQPASWWNSGTVDSINMRINSGTFIVQHRDHGEETGWGEPSYHISDMAGLNNQYYPIVFSINCLTGNFTYSPECFMEAFIRYPKRAVGGNAATQVSYSFVNDTYAWGYFDALWPIFMPDYPLSDAIPPEPPYRNLRPSLAMDFGKYFLNVSNWPYLGIAYKRATYKLFHWYCDVFQNMYSEVPESLNVTHAPFITPGSTTFTITADDSSWIALTKIDDNGEIVIIGEGEGTGSPTQITIEPQFPPETVIVTVTKYNHFRYVAYVPVVDMGMPATPTIVSPLDFARLPGLNPVLKFYSTDPQNEGIQYRVKWSLYPDFSISDSLTTSIYPSGEIVSVTLQNLELNKTYWWKVKCRDPQGSGYWTPYTSKRSFTVAGSNLPENTCSWFQKTGAQFSYNTFDGTRVEGDSVVLIPTGGTIVCTLLFENFEQGIVPSGWTVIDGNNDGYKWTVGTTDDIGSYPPPNYGTKYAFYTDDDAGNGVINYNEELWTPKIGIPQSASNLTFKYGYGFRVYEPGEKFRTHFRKKVGGVWTNWQQVRVYTASCSGTDSIDLTNQLPCDSIQFRFFYSDSTSYSHWGWACASDNVLIKYSYELQNNFGTMLTVPILYSELNATFPRTSWGDIVVYKGTENDSICIQVEYFDGSNWNLVPDNLLPGNGVGIYGDTISINNLPVNTYHTLRVRCLFYRKTTETPENPTLLSLEVGNLARVSSKIPFINVKRNIFKGNLIIIYSIPAGFDNISLKIYDVNGRCVRDLSKIVLKGKESEITVRDLRKGVYFIKFKAGEYRKDLKVIKIK